MKTEDFKVGDVVTDVILGETGKVVSVVSNGLLTYPVVANFPSGATESYTAEGRVFENSAVPILYHGEDVVIEINRPVYEYQVVFKAPDGLGMTHRKDDFYTSEQEFEQYAKIHGLQFVDLYLPSKRERK